MSRTNTSGKLLVSGSVTRSVAWLPNAMNRPSALITGSNDSRLPLRVPAAFTLTRRVTPLWRSRTNTSFSALKSLVTKSLARLRKATCRPSALITGTPHDPLPL